MLLYYLSLIKTEEERQLFARLCELHKKQMHFVANQILWNDAMSEDAVHNAFEGAARNMESLEGRSEEDMKNYLLKAAQNAAYNLSKKERKQEEYYEYLDSEAARREFAMVPAESELDYVFSDRFERRMRRMIRAEAHGYWNLINTTAKRVAIAAAIVIMLLSTAMAIKPIRERIIQFFIEVYEDYFEIRFGEEEKDDIDPTPQPMVRYTLTELPEGYEEMEFIESENLLWTNWKNENGHGISLQQETGTQEVTLDNFGHDMIAVECGSFSVFYKTHEKANCYTWERDGYPDRFAPNKIQICAVTGWKRSRCVRKEKG